MFAENQSKSPSLLEPKRGFSSQNPQMKQNLRDLASQQKRMDKQIKFAQARINYIRNKNRNNLQKIQRQSKKREIVEERSDLIRQEKEKLREQRFIRNLMRQRMIIGNRRSKSQSKQTLDLKTKDIQFLPGIEKSHPNPKRLFSFFTPSNTSAFVVKSASPEMLLAERKEQITEIRAQREQRYKEQKLLMYSTKYEKAEELRNFKELVELKEIDESKKKITQIKEKQELLLERLELSKKFKEKCIEEYLINNLKYKDCENNLKIAHQKQ